MSMKSYPQSRFYSFKYLFYDEQMKIKVSKKELLRGLGDTEMAILKRYPLEDFYYFEAIPDIKVNPNALTYIKNYPELNILTRKEFKIFCDILNCEEGMHSSQLKRHLINPESHNAQNTVLVHIKNIRLKLKGFKIETIRNNMTEAGGTYRATVRDK